MLILLDFTLESLQFLPLCTTGRFWKPKFDQNLIIIYKKTCWNVDIVSLIVSTISTQLYILIPIRLSTYYLLNSK